MEYGKRETIIITDSASDLRETDGLKHTKIIPYKFYFKGDEEKMYQDIPLWSDKDFYARLKCGVKAICTTIDIDMLLNELNSALENNQDVIILYSANIIDPNIGYILEDIKEHFQSLNINMNIAAINTNLISLGTGLLVRKCDSMIENGAYFESVLKYVLDNKKLYNFEFVLPNSEILLESKVISSRKMALSNLLGLDNVYSVNSNGIYIKRRVDKKDILKYLYDDLFSNADSNEEIGISYTNANEFVEMLEDKTNEFCKDDKCVVKRLSKTNGTYMGPDMIGVSYKRKQKSSNNK